MPSLYPAYRFRRFFKPLESPISIFFSLDVEGAELEVLQTLDFTAFHVSVLVIEQDGGNPGKDKALRQLLAARGFVLDKSLKSIKAGSRNDWFVNKHFDKSEAPKSSWDGLA